MISLRGLVLHYIIIIKMIIIMIMTIYIMISKPTFLWGWNLVLSFCFADAAADNRPRGRRPGHCDRHCTRRCRRETQKPGKRSGAELWPSSGLGIGARGALPPGACAGRRACCPEFGLKLTLSSRSVTLMMMSGHHPTDQGKKISGKDEGFEISPKQSGAREGCGEPAAEEEVELPRCICQLPWPRAQIQKVFVFCSTFKY